MKAGEKLLALQPDPRTMRLYQTYHDCGKHLCRTADEARCQHFEGHAAASAAAWRAACGDKDPRGDIAWLIERDMLLHTGSSEECAQLQGHRLAPALIFTALAELHANARMFGGAQSTSAKIKLKLKHIKRRAGSLVRSMQWNEISAIG